MNKEASRVTNDRHSRSDASEYSNVRVIQGDVPRISLCSAKLTVSGEIPVGGDGRWSYHKVVSRALDALERELAAKLPEPLAAGQPSAMAQA